MPRELSWRGTTVLSGIVKEPVDAPVMIRAMNLDGDAQADLSVHGGAAKAVYVYPSEHYPFWRKELPGVDLPWGMFGENLTTEGLLEETVHAGDRFRVGDAELIVTQPRLPCYKLEMKFRRVDIAERFLASGRTGFYLSVLRGGMVRAGDGVELLEEDPESVSIADLVRLRQPGEKDRDVIGRARRIAALPEGWKKSL
ncbi:MAG TPA: MOSC domain-containing protein [Bacteroidota bacterium]|nr:MOSC domain-containing protein [Bacteroidota bacterium]